MIVTSSAAREEGKDTLATSFLRGAEETGTGPDNDTVDDGGAGGSRPDPSRPALPSSYYSGDADNA